MRAKNNIILFCFLICAFELSAQQSQVYQQVFKTADKYVQDIEDAKAKIQAKIDAEEAKPKPNQKKLAKLEAQLENYLFNSKMLNVLFADEVGAFFNSSKDLTLQKYYANLDVDSKSLSFGLTFDISRGGDKLKPLNWLLSLGLKAKAKNKFTALYKNGEFQDNELGLTVKLTNVNPGTINYTSISSKKGENGKSKILFDRGKNIENYRYILLEDKKREILDYEINKYYKGLEVFKTPIESNNTLTAAEKNEKIKSFKEKKDAEFYQSIAEAEVKYLKDNKLYRYVKGNWWSFDFFVPLNKSKYNLINSSTNTIIEDNFSPFKLSGTYSHFKRYSSGISYYLSSQLVIQNNNNILVNQLSASTFQSETQQLNGGVIIDTKEVYDTTYEDFITTSLKFEIVCYLYKNTLGISPAIEQNLGKYDKLNWKLGIPISLKDKEGKPSINFELQWKEINTFTDSNRFIGISASYMFGKFIN